MESSPNVACSGTAWVCRSLAGLINVVSYYIFYTFLSTTSGNTRSKYGNLTNVTQSLSSSLRKERISGGGEKTEAGEVRDEPRLKQAFVPL